MSYYCCDRDDVIAIFDRRPLALVSCCWNGLKMSNLLVTDDDQTSCSCADVSSGYSPSVFDENFLSRFTDLLGTLTAMVGAKLF